MKKFILLCFLIIAPVSAFAQSAPSSELQELRQEVKLLQEALTKLTNKLDQQQEKIKKLEKVTTQTPPPNSAPPQVAANVAPSAPPPARTPPNYNQSLLNPEIGLVANFTANSTESNTDEDGNDRLSVSEIEFMIGHEIDPYSRFDSTFTVSDFEDFAIEEAYVSYWGLPADIKARIGQIRPKIGKASSIHADQLDTIDEPLYVQSYLGSEGLFKTGVELSTFIPTPWSDSDDVKLTHELIGTVFNGGVGEGGDLFADNLRRPTYHLRERNFWEINDFNNLDFNLTYMVGSGSDDSYDPVNVLGADSTYEHYFNAIQKIKLTAEGMLRAKDGGINESNSSDSDSDVPSQTRTNPWGMYFLADYTLDPSWSLGYRWDYVQPVEANTLRTAEIANSAYITFHQSEFSRWRFEYQNVDLAEGGLDNLFWLQLTIAIGVHKHQLK